MTTRIASAVVRPRPLPSFRARVAPAPARRDDRARGDVRARRHARRASLGSRQPHYDGERAPFDDDDDDRPLWFDDASSTWRRRDDLDESDATIARALGGDGAAWTRAVVESAHLAEVPDDDALDAAAAANVRVAGGEAERRARVLTVTLRTLDGDARVLPILACATVEEEEEEEEEEDDDDDEDEVLKERRSPRERGRMGTSHDEDDDDDGGCQNPNPRRRRDDRGDDDELAQDDDYNDAYLKDVDPGLIRFTPRDRRERWKRAVKKGAEDVRADASADGVSTRDALTLCYRYLKNCLTQTSHVAAGRHARYRDRDVKRRVGSGSPRGDFGERGGLTGLPARYMSSPIDIPGRRRRGGGGAGLGFHERRHRGDLLDPALDGPVDDVFDAWQLANDPRPSYGRPADVAPWLRNAFRDDVETLNACLHDVTCSDAIVFAHEALPPLRALDVEPEEVEELLSQIEADAAAACVKITSGSGPALYRARLHGARRARVGARDGFDGAVERVREIELDLDDAWPRPPKSRPRPSSSSSSSFSADSRRRRRRRRRGLEDVVAICAAMKRGVPIYIASDVVDARSFSANGYRSSFHGGRVGVARRARRASAPGSSAAPGRERHDDDATFGFRSPLTGYSYYTPANADEHDPDVFSEFVRFFVLECEKPFGTSPFIVEFGASGAVGNIRRAGAGGRSVSPPGILRCVLSYCIQKFFTHRSVSTFDRVPFQLTGELFLYGTPLSRALLVGPIAFFLLVSHLWREWQRRWHGFASGGPSLGAQTGKHGAAAARAAARARSPLLDRRVLDPAVADVARLHVALFRRALIERARDDPTNAHALIADALGEEGAKRVDADAGEVFRRLRARVVAEADGGGGASVSASARAIAVIKRDIDRAVCTPAQLQGMRVDDAPSSAIEASATTAIEERWIEHGAAARRLGEMNARLFDHAFVFSEEIWGVAEEEEEEEEEEDGDDEDARGAGVDDARGEMGALP
jgi:hypothetical protein